MEGNKRKKEQYLQNQLHRLGLYVISLYNMNCEGYKASNKDDKMTGYNELGRTLDCLIVISLDSPIETLKIHVLTSEWKSDM